MIQARIESISEKKMVGKKIKMSFSNIQTPNLWRSFMPQRKQITKALNNNLFSVEVYNTANFFESFDPSAEFEKWAAIEVSDFKDIPPEMETLIIPAGEYAVFIYKGRGSKASNTYRSIIQDWIPKSKYILDHRPHFAVMGEKYKKEDPASEEELWFPIKKK